MDFTRSKLPPRLFSPGEVVECIDASGAAGLRKGAIYRVDQVTRCPCVGRDGGVTLTSGPSGTDSPCGWWRATRFRPVKPEDDETLQRIKSCKPRAPVRETEDA